MTEAGPLSSVQVNSFKVLAYSKWSDIPYKKQVCTKALMYEA